MLQNTYEDTKVCLLLRVSVNSTSDTVSICTLGVGEYTSDVCMYGIQ